MNFLFLTSTLLFWLSLANPILNNGNFVPVAVQQNEKSFNVFLVVDYSKEKSIFLINKVEAAKNGEEKVVSVQAFSDEHVHMLIMNVRVKVTEVSPGKFQVQQAIESIKEIESFTTRPISQELTIGEDDDIVRGPCHVSDEDETEGFEADVPESVVANSKAALPAPEAASLENDDEDDESPCGGGGLISQILDLSIFFCLVLLFFHIISYVGSFFYTFNDEYEQLAGFDDGKYLGSVSLDQEKKALAAKEMEQETEKDSLLPKYTPL